MYNKIVNCNLNTISHECDLTDGSKNMKIPIKEYPETVPQQSRRLRGQCSIMIPP